MMPKFDAAHETGWGFCGNVGGGAIVEKGRELACLHPNPVHCDMNISPNIQTEIEPGHRAPSLPGEIECPEELQLEHPDANGLSQSPGTSDDALTQCESRDSVKLFELHSSCRELNRLSQGESGSSSWFIDVDRTSELSSTGSMEAYSNEFRHSEGSSVAYQQEWKAIYTAEKYRPLSFRILTALFATYFVGYGSYLIIQEYERTPDFFGQDTKDRMWTICERAPLPVGGFISFLFLCFSFVPASRSLWARHHDLLYAFWIILVYTCRLADLVMWELRLYNCVPLEKHITREIEYVDGWRPVLTCTDSDPVRTLLDSLRSHVQPGCSSPKADGFRFGFLLVCCWIPFVLKLSTKSAWFVAVANGLVWIVACFVTDYWNLTALWCLGFQMTASISAGVLCQQRERDDQRKFAISMSIRFTYAIHRELLDTLIPTGVLKILDSAGDRKQTAMSIPFCTVMFCMIDYEATSPADFEFIDSLFAELDEAVEQSGMYKYQHVSCGSCHNFIVTCPLVSTPTEDEESEHQKCNRLFRNTRGEMESEEESSAEYPYNRYYSDMIVLGFNLMRITRVVVSRTRDRPSVGSRDILMKVGISSGSASGVVLGACRRFYCVYGDTVNTAARMCKFSEVGKIRVTSEIGERVTDPEFPKRRLFISRSPGPVNIKGKGTMIVFDLSATSQFYSTQHSKRKALARKVSTNKHFMWSGDEEESLSEDTSQQNFWTMERITRLHHSSMSQMEERFNRDHAVNIVPFCNIRMWMVDKLLHDTVPEQSVYPSCCLRELEKDFHLSQSHLMSRRNGMTACTIFHFAACLWQWQVIVYPDHEGYFSHHGNDILGHRKDLSEILLASQFVTSFVVGCLILYGIGTFGVWKRTIRDWINSRHVVAVILEKKDRRTVDSDDSLQSSNHVQYHNVQICQWAFLFLKVYMLCVSCAIWYLWPSRRSQAANFSLLSCTNFGLGFYAAGLSVRASLVSQLFAISFFIWLMTPGALMITSDGAQTADERLTQLEARVLQSFHICFIISASVMIRILTMQERKLWRRDLFHSFQLLKIRNTLHDLVPPAYATQMIMGCHVPSTSSRVVVLQLDICNFTVLSQTMSPTNLANLINDLVSEFDKCVIHHGVTKIDTIGDAYIAVGWLSPGTEPNVENARFNQRKCRDMLVLANFILSGLVTHREKSGVDLHGRIGLAVGNVVSGVLGRLQPRFAVFGEAMSRAADLEATGPRDSVHCSLEFLEMVQTGDIEMETETYSAAFSAEIAYNRRLGYRSARKLNRASCNGFARRPSVQNFVEKMMADGKLVVQQNMMLAEPVKNARGTVFHKRRSVSFVGSDSTETEDYIDPSSFDMRRGTMMQDPVIILTSIDSDGNFLHARLPEPYHTTIDSYGNLQGLKLAHEDDPGAGITGRA